MSSIDVLDCPLSLSINDRMVKESAKTIRTTQKTIEGLVQQCQRTSQDKEAVRGELVHLTSNLKQTARTHQEKVQALQNKLEQLKNKTNTMQQTLTETARTCNERIDMATRAQPAALQALTQATQERRAALERSHAQTIATLERAHTETMSTLTRSHTSALTTLQTQFNQITRQQNVAVNQARHSEAERSRLTAELNTTQTSLQGLSRELATQQDIQARIAKNAAKWASMNPYVHLNANDGRP